MVVPHKKAVLVSFVRITSQNKGIRANIAGAGYATYNLTEGLYWFGLAGPYASPCSDTSYGGAPSFLDLVHTITGMHMAVQQPAGGGIPTIGYTGWLCGSRAGAGGNDVIDWDHAATTVDPRWFGKLKTAGVYGTTTLTSTVTIFSIASSSMVFIPQSNVRVDREITEPLEQVLSPDSGANRSAYYGMKEYRQLEFRVSGIPRDSADCTYQSLRRFTDTLKMREPVFYWPDISEADPPPEHAEDSTDRLYGRQKLIPAAKREVRWDEKPAFGNYYSEWYKSLLFQQYVA